MGDGEKKRSQSFLLVALPERLSPSTRNRLIWVGGLPEAPIYPCAVSTLVLVKLRVHTPPPGFARASSTEC